MLNQHTKYFLLLLLFQLIGPVIQRAKHGGDEEEAD